ncbi:cytochrome c1 [Kingella negevensis]|uniref:cytochrome c1 n=1 Tax=Kingella negevensis TaxID=1522312 RepID=UPI00050A1E84|nr:cytochrome c1 [Kingella negevensis]MDK4689120.1 cytochrome c1 [Kingella negevensis]WII90702.1 cytochrome c1 [Kingella negevensis]
MKKALKNVIAALLVAAPMSMAVASSGGHYEHAEIDPRDQVSLQRGAQIFVNNCLSCHSAAAMRYNRLQDIGLSEDEIKKNLMFTTDKVGDVMQAHMSPADSKKWFGKTPPDLTLIARSRGADYIYAYLRGFYKDPTTPTGWNNTMLPKAAMPHVLWEQEGVKVAKLDKDGKMVLKADGTPDWTWESTGKLTRMTKDGKVITKEFDTYAKDLTNFMAYMAEPAQVQRKQIGYIVLMFLLAVMLPLAYFLKKEYWKDVH